MCIRDSIGGAQYGGPRRYTSAKIYGWGKGLDAYPNYTTDRQIGGTNSVIDYAVTNTLTGVGGSQVSAVGTGTYPHEIRLSNYDVHFSSEYPINGSTIELQFVNPDNRDGISILDTAGRKETLSNFFSFTYSLKRDTFNPPPMKEKCIRDSCCNNSAASNIVSISLATPRLPVYIT